MGAANMVYNVVAAVGCLGIATTMYFVGMELVDVIQSAKPAAYDEDLASASWCFRL